MLFWELLYANILQHASPAYPSLRSTKKRSTADAVSRHQIDQLIMSTNYILLMRIQRNLTMAKRYIYRGRFLNILPRFRPATRRLSR